MIHSAWDWDQGCYHYFRSPIPASVGGWKPLTGLGIRPRSANGASVGVHIEEALPLLPRNAVYVGSGAQAVGQLVRPAQPRFLTAPGGLEAAGAAPSTCSAAPMVLLGLGIGMLFPTAKWLLALGAAVVALRSRKASGPNA